MDNESMEVEPKPTTVLDMSNNPGGTGNWNQPVGPAPEKASINPGLRGYDNDHDADDD
jgi:hypothetical protein